MNVSFVGFFLSLEPISFLSCSWLTFFDILNFSLYFLSEFKTQGVSVNQWMTHSYSHDDVIVFRIDARLFELEDIIVSIRETNQIFFYRKSIKLLDKK